MGELFYLVFHSDGFGKVEIEEPVGYSSTSFELKQKEKGYARDISFGGNETPFEFTNFHNHYLEKLLYYNHRFGFESKVDLIIQIEGIDNLIGELDFATATTDDLEYFKCKVIQQGDYQVINRRKQVKVDLLSNRDIDGNYIAPLIPQNMLLLSKPIYQKSEWNQISAFNKRLETRGNRFYTINPCQNIVKSDIEDTLTFFSNESNNFNDFKLIEVQNTSKNTTVQITGCSGTLNAGSFNGGNGYIQFRLMLRHGKFIPSPDVFTRDSSEFAIPLITKDLDDEEADWSFAGDFTVNIPNLERGDFVWLSYEFYLHQSGSLPTATLTCNALLELASVKIDTASYSYNSITPTIRLIDVMRQVVKSISGLNIIAPRFDIGGQFYDNLLFNGNFLRMIIDKGFMVSLGDIEKSLVEMNGDFSIETDGRIFFGIEKDYYSNIECGFFDNTQFSQMNKMPNPRFTVNEFWFRYKKYQSLKENEEPNSADEIHGESKWAFFNKRVENKKEIEVEWTRSAFIIEENRKKALVVSDSTSTQDADTLLITDCVNTIDDVHLDEVTKLQHTALSVDTLSLKNKGDVNFIAMGITIGSSFTIKAPDNNARNYTVYEVSSTELKLTKISGADINTSDDGIRVTNYSYTILKETIPFTNYTNQNITAFNLVAPDSYSNLRYSIGQNMWNYWKEYISTVNLYWKEKPLINTWYKNNPKCTIVYNGKTTTEGNDFISEEVMPILSPFLYNEVIYCDVEKEEFILLQKKIRDFKGFIRGIDNNDKVIKVYPITMKWDVLSRQVTIKGEEKYEPTEMTINTAGSITTINDETKTRFLDWDIIDDKLSVYDTNRQRLYNPVYWNSVKINGAFAQSLNELKEWMELIP